MTDQASTLSLETTGGRPRSDRRILRTRLSLAVLMAAMAGVVAVGKPVATSADVFPTLTVQTSFIEVIAESPTFSTDDTLFAAGVGPISGSATPCCLQRALFRSQDGGHSWQTVYSDDRSEASPVAAGQILISPHYDTDHTLFTLTQSGVFKSSDGGSTFSLAVPGGFFVGDIGAAPSGTDARLVLISAQIAFTEPVPILFYDVQSGSLTEGATLPLMTLQALPRFAEDWNHVVVGGSRSYMSDANGNSAYVAHCDLSACTTVGLKTTPADLGVSVAAVMGDSTVFAYAPVDVYVSHDYGLTFSQDPPAIVSSGSVSTIQLTPSFPSTATVFFDGAQPTSNGSFQSLYEVGTATATTGYTSEQVVNAPANTFYPATRLDNGRLLARPSSGGIPCSIDDGATWQPMC